MIHIIESDVKRSELIMIAKKVNLKGYSRWKKRDILNAINTLFAKRVCEKYMKRKVSVKYMNNIDPITQEEITSPYYEVELKKGQIFRYSMMPFYSYMVTTGKFQDPYTSIEFTSDQLKQMDKQMFEQKIYNKPL